MQYKPNKRKNQQQQQQKQRQKQQHLPVRQVRPKRESATGAKRARTAAKGLSCARVTTSGHTPSAVRYVSE